MKFILSILFFTLACKNESQRVKISYKASENLLFKHDANHLETEQNKQQVILEDGNSLSVLSKDMEESQKTQEANSINISANDAFSTMIYKSKGKVHFEEKLLSNFFIYQMELENMVSIKNIDNKFYGVLSNEASEFNLKSLSFCLPSYIYELSLSSGGFVFFSEKISELRFNNLPEASYFQYIKIEDENANPYDPFVLEKKQSSQKLFFKVVDNSCKDRGYLTLEKTLSLSSTFDPNQDIKTSDVNATIFDPNVVSYILKLVPDKQDVSGFLFISKSLETPPTSSSSTP